MTGDDNTELGYADAVAELESILTEIEDESVDIDTLAAKVRRAAVLIRLCRDRISGARLEIEQIVQELDEREVAPSLDDAALDTPSTTGIGGESG